MRPFAKDAGFAPGSDDRIARSAKAGQKTKERLIREGQRDPVSRPLPSVVQHSGELLPILPPEFIAECMARLEIHIASGHWAQCLATICQLAEEWNYRREQQAASVRPEMHVSVLALDSRAINQIEACCAGTVGSLVEAFPTAFVGKPNIGGVTIERIGRALLRAGMFDAEECNARITSYYEEANKR